MNWLQSIFYGLISGLSQFMPISAKAHGDMVLYLFGISGSDAVLSLVVHLSLLLALFVATKHQLDKLRQHTATTRQRRRRFSPISTQAIADRRLVKNATLPMLVTMLVVRYIFRADIQLPLVSLFLLLNGIALYLPERMMHGNKDASGMSLFDSYLIGIAGALCTLSGLSAIGLIIAIALARGADRQKTWFWSLLLMYPCLFLLGIMDIFSLISGGSGRVVSNFFGYLLAGIFTFIAGNAGIRMMQRFVRSNSFAGFAYYCWGAALFSFLMYLIVF